MKFDVVTLFPNFFISGLQSGLIGKALSRNIATVNLVDPRQFTTDNYRKVDDKPYGGGVGMLLKPEPIFAAVNSLQVLPRRSTILLSPQGSPLTQDILQTLVTNYEQLILICGHYEGFDERIRFLANQEISLGDFVLTGGEIPALTLINGVVRLLPGTVGKSESLKTESFNSSLLDYPQYTHPPVFKNMHVPDILRSGNHKLITKWRREQQIQRTQKRRPDLLEQWLNSEKH
ncbi:tRNA (guanosine(37)-N1)-methyltransferase TrmD [Candidatus Atelocyanobacterium thalassae]|uniref:tRNA (guanine-N(1)-)-methyltransferase n=1 Tax=cyanobacterium endosymbiont of Braarudosphaera bigelowii TaxID=1285375 RepID=A0ABM7U3Q5_9CHRO|nr:tRNA (guanosine(37)-N1)-methyltransferase TrmD [Candidatus Atelocyanobacterium thalassa]BDA39205.1 tRNA (guanine-N(1)-)-methyltransferase [cyanobacterium endosymbiont of Braarudosphaera bigelowii]